MGDDNTVVPKSKFVRLVAAFGTGILFGWLLNKAGVHNAGELRGQFDFSNFTMLKTFLAATGTSTVIMTYLYTSTNASMKKTVSQAGEGYRRVIGLPATLFGTALVGAGMSIAGACPGTVWVQLGAGSVSSLVTLAGGITGASVYGMLYPYIEPLISAGSLTPHKASIRDHTSSATLIGYGMGAAMIAAGLLFPPTSPLLPTSLSIARWNPGFVGILVGSLQLLLTPLVGKNLGSATTMQVLASQVFRCTDSFPELVKTRGGFEYTWQPLYLLGAVCGSALAAWVAGTSYNAVEVSATQAFLGGMVGIFGARVAGGCTSGHGISGVSHLMFRSMAAVVAMFAGAIVTKAALGI